MAVTQSKATSRDGKGVERLVEIMARLRDPQTGCPWDVAQDFASIAPYTIEEAYEVLDAINRDDMGDLKEELGDLLLQVVFHSQMASEADRFTLEDVAETISDKMVRRHPHVFGEAEARDSAAQTRAWEEQKALERAQKLGGDPEDVSALQGVAKALPALLRAEKLQKRAARTGFDWATPEPIFDKLTEETGELKEAMVTDDIAHIEEEMGDVLFVCANLARRLGIDPEVALRKANDKFEARFRAMEDLAKEDGVSFAELSLDQQEALWTRVKASRRQD